MKKTNSLHENFVFSSDTNRYHRSTKPLGQEMYQEDFLSSDGYGYGYGYNTPAKVVNVNDRHVQESIDPKFVK